MDTGLAKIREDEHLAITLSLTYWSFCSNTKSEMRSEMDNRNNMQLLPLMQLRTLMATFKHEKVCLLSVGNLAKFLSSFWRLPARIARQPEFETHKVKRIRSFSR